MFCAVVIAMRLLGSLLSKRWRSVFEAMLALKALLLIVGAPLAIRFGPFQNADNWQAVVTGMVLVAAMAIQNAAHRIDLGSAPPSTLMTGTTMQIMIDLAHVFLLGGKQRQSRTPLTKMSVNVLVFAAGCAAAALLFMQFGDGCFALPPILGVIALAARVADSSKQAV